GRGRRIDMHRRYLSGRVDARTRPVQMSVAEDHSLDWRRGNYQPLQCCDACHGDRAGASKTSTTTGSTLAAPSASTLVVERVVPTTPYPARSSSGTSRLPIAPVAPAKNIFKGGPPCHPPFIFLNRLHQIGRRRSFGSNIDRE